MTKHPVIILGMHRSGTSLFADLLNSMGVFIGNDLNTHKESKSFLELNDQILKISHSYWDSPTNMRMLIENGVSKEKTIKLIEKEVRKISFQIQFYGWKNYFVKPSHNFKWGWKEPRTTATFPIWQGIFPEAKYIFIYRNGIDVANSLNQRELKREGSINSEVYSLRCLNFNESFNLWEEYNTIVERYKTTIPPSNFLTLGYEELLNDPNKTLIRVKEFLDLQISKKTINQLTGKIRTSNVNKYQEDSALMKKYFEYRNHDLMVKYGYNAKFIDDE